MRTALFLLALVAIPALAAQTVWKWVDERGVTHYSDRPIPGATRVEIATSNRAEPRPPAATVSAQPPTQPAAPAYRNFEIWKPADGESIVNTGGQVTVNVRLDGGLQSGDNILLYLDNRRVEGFEPGATSFELKDVPRGQHTLVAVISNSRGARLQETAPVTFMVRQESIASPPVGPALRPPPKSQGVSNKLPSRQPTYSALNGARPAIDPATNAPAPSKSAPKPGPKQGS